MRFVKRPRLALYLIVWFLVIAFAPLTAVTFMTLQESESTIHEVAARNLEATATRQIQQMEGYLRDRETMATGLSNTATFANALREMSAVHARFPYGSEEYAREDAEHQPYLRGIKDSMRWYDVLLIDREGHVVATVMKESDTGTNLISGPWKESQLGRAYRRSMALVSPELSDWGLYAPSAGLPAAFVIAPVLDGKVLLGAAALQLRHEEIEHITNDYTGLGRTGETVIASRAGGDALFLSGTRHDPDAGYRRVVRIGSGDFPALEGALDGRDGFGLVRDYRGEQVLAAWRYFPFMRWGVVVKVDADEAFEPVARIREKALQVATATILAVVVAALFLARRISLPLVQLKKTAESIAVGDLTVAVDGVRRGDEIGELHASVRGMADSLRALVGQGQRSSRLILETATGIAATSRQQEATVVQLGNSSNEIAATAKEISSISRELAETMTDVSGVAARTAALAAEGRQGLSNMHGTMDALEEGASAISAQLAELSEKAKGITSVIATITKVADQTNLLSLNAAIEAEKAGEAGLGFGVVAREIRRLADQTAVATLDIEKMVREMQNAVHDGVESIGRFTGDVRSAASKIEGIGTQMADILSQVQNLLPRFEEVSQGMKAQAEGAGQISESISQLSDATRQAAEALVDFNRVIEELGRASTSLQGELGRFRVN